jgi:4-diphosphocytidyl-2-C-methyl-D-erythritol kinase
LDTTDLVTFASHIVKAPAKLNIRLKITGIRPDGYHELVSIMVPVDLFDLLEVSSKISGGIALACEGFHVPCDETNLVHRAAQSFLLRTGIQIGVRIKLVKGVPVSAGMGGGSSDAAAVLLALNEMCSGPLSQEELHSIAIQLGADVPFFLYGRPAIARGIGEILEPLGGWPNLWYVIVTPPLQVSTAWVYGNLKSKKLTAGEYDYIRHVLEKDHFTVSHILENDLEAVTSASFPVIETIKKHLLDAGAEGALMTGSGPTVFGVFSSQDQAILARKHAISWDLGDVFLAKGWERR